jgi:hypothetical protein
VKAAASEADSARYVGIGSNDARLTYLSLPYHLLKPSHELGIVADDLRVLARKGRRIGRGLRPVCLTQIPRASTVRYLKACFSMLLTATPFTRSSGRRGQTGGRRRGAGLLRAPQCRRRGMTCVVAIYLYTACWRLERVSVSV